MCIHVHTRAANTYMHICPHVHRDTCTHMCIRTYLYLSLLNHCTSSLMLKLWLLGRTCSHLGPSFQPSDYCYFLTCTRSVLRGMWKWTRRKRLPHSVDGILAPTKLLRYPGRSLRPHFPQPTQIWIKFVSFAETRERRVEANCSPGPSSPQWKSHLVTYSQLPLIQLLSHGIVLIAV